MAIGTLGNVVFEVSSELVRTFSDMTETVSARWTAHEVIGQKPRQEYIGPALRTRRFAMTLRSDLGLDPVTESAALEASAEDGEVLALVIGGRPLGDWVITELRRNERHIAADGTIRTIDLQLSLEEYV